VRATNAVICGSVSKPDGDDGRIDLIGVMQELVFLSASLEAVFRGVLYVTLEDCQPNVPYAIRWTSERTRTTHTAFGELQTTPGVRIAHLELPLEMPCPLAGWYQLEFQAGTGPPLTQSIEVRKVPP
jgi:hypothetical protein